MSSWTVNSNGETVQINDSDDSMGDLIEVDYKMNYRQLKNKLKYLIFENEFFQENLRQNQERLLKVTRDRNFLLDQLLKYEKPPKESSSDDSSSAEDEVPQPKRKFSEPMKLSAAPTTIKKRKIVIGMKRDMQGDKEAMIEKLQARENRSEMTSTFSTVPQEIFSNEPSMDSTYGEM